ncbi:endocuticle structural glycoprotein SgAbd-8-like [Euwallacea fornicatus]|uniref:endocuticle structural glycoprotein SgAbd-8-like n=1 Tax=Euwallacea fornicatus TaxID=995702 RepID=UPI00338E3467
MKVLVILAISLMGVSVAQRRLVPQGFQQIDEGEDQKPQGTNDVPQQEDRSHHRELTTPIPILRFDKEQGNDGSYKALWETGNNIVAHEEGFLKTLGPDPDEEGSVLAAQVQQGSYSYTAPDGQLIKVDYIADEKGFHPIGDHLPTPPPVSPEVQKGLDLIFAGIKAQQEADEREKPQEQQQNPNLIEPEYNNGQYRQ